MEGKIEISNSFQSNDNVEEILKQLEVLLRNYLSEHEEFNENVPISNEINSACNQISKNYLAELRQIIFFIFNEIDKISNHFIQTINYFYDLHQGYIEEKFEKEHSEYTGDGESITVSELVMFLNSTTDFIEKTSLILDEDEITENNAKLIESIDHLLKSAKDKHVMEINDLTYLIANKVVN